MAGPTLSPAQKFSNNIDLQQNQTFNRVMQQLASAPSGPKVGQDYYNTASLGGFLWNGTAWRPMDAALLTDGSIPFAGVNNIAGTVKGYSLDMFAAPVSAVSMNSQKLSLLATGTANTDAVNLGQMNAAISAAVSGQTSVKNPVRVVAVANQAALSGLLTIDGITLVAGDRVLLTAQTTATQNLIYVAASGAWTIATDNAAAGQLIEGTDLLVNEGTLYAGTIWRCTNSDQSVVTPGTTSVTWTQTAKINTYTADGVTLALTGQQFSVSLLAGGGIVSGGPGLKLDQTVAVVKYNTTVTGDGVTQLFTITHNLGTTNVNVSVRDSTGHQLMCDNQANSASQVALSWGIAPASGAVFSVSVFA